MCLGNALTLTSIYAESEEELQKLAQKLSCMGTSWVEPEVPTRSGGTSSDSLRTPAGSSQQMTCATSAVRTPPHHSAGESSSLVLVN